MTSTKPFSRASAELWLAVALASLASFWSPARAQELDLTGSLGLELRGFFSAPVLPGQAEGLQPSLQASARLDGETKSGRHQFTLEPFARLDGRDDERSHFDLRQAYWRRVASDWEVLAGLDRVFWGVTESRHLVDVVNQDDAVEDVDGEDKLGQPMVVGKLHRSWGSLAVYLMPLFRERTFPGVEGRLRPGLPVATERPIFESAAGKRHLDLALRYSHFVGSWDLGVSAFSGTSREPAFVLDREGEALRPLYQQISQLGVDIQNTRGAWLWKLEALAREGQGPTFGAVVAGFEYTLYQALGSADVGLLAEYLHDGRDPRLAPPTPFEDDVFVGARLALNDARDTSILVGAVIDAGDRSTYSRLEAERRLGSRWKLEIEGRMFHGIPVDDPFFSLASDDFLTLRLSRFF